MKRILGLFLLVLLIAAAGAAGLAWFATRPLTLHGDLAEFTIARGSSLRQAATRISAAGVDVQPLLLVWLVRLTGKAGQIKAGSYEVGPGLTAWELVEKLTRGDVSQRELIVIEGWTFAQLRSAIEAHPDLQHDSTGLSDREILARIGAAESHPEGLFFPDTYLFDKQSSDLHLLQRAYHAMKSRLQDAWAQRASGLPLASPYEALTLASIGEKERGRREDRPMIASVFVNRLKAGMRLQTDPTVIYGLGERFDGNLRKADLNADTPYNSYPRDGLPPTPICLPGMDAILATLQPAPSKFLYFVARGDGSSEFSADLDTHNRAVDRFQRGRR
jgi:UPF0755 protein